MNAPLRAQAQQQIQHTEPQVGYGAIQGAQDPDSYGPSLMTRA